MLKMSTTKYVIRAEVTSPSVNVWLVRLPSTVLHQDQVILVIPSLTNVEKKKPQMYQVSILKHQASHRWEEGKKKPNKTKYQHDINVIESFRKNFDGIVLLNHSQHTVSPPPPPPPLLPVFRCFLCIHRRISLNLLGMLLPRKILHRGYCGLWEQWASCDLICSWEMYGTQTSSQFGLFKHTHTHTLLLLASKAVRWNSPECTYTYCSFYSATELSDCQLLEAAHSFSLPRLGLKGTCAHSAG